MLDNIINTYVNRGIALVKGQGAYLLDQSGQKYLDMMSNYGVNIFGYNQPEITKALKGQLGQLTTLHGSFNNNLRVRAAAKLIRHCQGKLRQVYFSNSGAEAVEAALKFARIASGKTKVIAMKDGYHGKTLGALSVTGTKKYRQSLENLLGGVELIEYGNLDALENSFDEQTAAVILEPIQGESGIIIPPNNYLKQVARLCRERKVLLIADEIQTGMGRTGKFLASQHPEIEPDIVCLGKGLAGGIPVGATLVSQSVGEKIPKGFQTSTFGGNPLACRGMVEILSLVDKNKMDQVTKLGEYFMDRLISINDQRVVEIRGQGLMIGVEVKGNRNQVLKDMQGQRVLVGPAGDQVVRFLPPYIVTKKQINQAVSVFEQSL